MKYRTLALVAGATLSAAACQAFRSESPSGPMAKPGLEEGWNWEGKTVQGGDARKDLLTIEKMNPGKLQLGDSFEYVIRVRNVSSTKLTDVVVTDEFPEEFTFEGSTPAATRAGSELRWKFGEMAPAASHEIRVRGVVSAPGGCYDCRATVSFVPFTPAAPPPPPVAVAPPPPPPVAILALTKTAPADVCFFDDIPIRLVVKNTGKAKATDVKVTDRLPEGWTAGGKTAVSFDAGALEPGAAKEFTYNARSSRTGKFGSKATATAAGGLTADAAADTAVHKALLEITKTAASKSMVIGGTATFTVTVKNVGDWVSSKCTITDTMTGADSITAPTEGGKITGSTIVWNLGDLAPGASKTVAVKAARNAAGDIDNSATATGGCAEPVTAKARTNFFGIPAVLLEVTDNPDPVPVGGTTVYTIVVTNQGTATSREITITAALDPGVEFVSGTGSTQCVLKDGKVNCSMVATLEPKAQAKWTVTVRGTKAMDSRFKLVLTTKDTDRPIEETEATRFYSIEGTQ